MSDTPPTMTTLVIEDTFDGYGRLMAASVGKGSIATAVAYPCDEVSLSGPLDAARIDLITPILVGPAARIQAIADEHGLDIGGLRIVDVADSEDAAYTKRT